MTPRGEVIALDGGRVTLIGHLDTVRERGIRPVRIPVAAWPHFPPAAENLRAVSMQASGVRIAFVTAATRVELDVVCTRFQVQDFLGARNAFVAEVDGEPRATVASPVDAILHVPLSGDAQRVEEFSPSSTVVFDDLPRGDKTVTVWLPQGMIVDLLDVRADRPIEAASPTGRPVWVHHGSSISHGVETPLPTGTWPVVAARAADLDVINLGFGGQCMLDPFVADALAETPADVISLKVGVNIVGARSMDQRTFAPALHGFLDRVRRGHPETPIVVASSILWPDSDDRPGPSDVEFLEDGIRCFTAGDPTDIARGALTLAVSRRHIEHVVRTRADAGEAIHYLDGLSLYGPDDVARFPLPDGLHPDEALYREMGARFAARAFGPDGLVPRGTLGG
jgi:hypothetical protein